MDRKIPIFVQLFITLNIFLEGKWGESGHKFGKYQKSKQHFFKIFIPKQNIKAEYLT